MISPAFQLLICCLLTCTASAILPVPVGLRVKPGQCPSDVDFPRCEIITNDVKGDCVTDYDCKGKAKCCFSGCQNRCLLPLQDKTDSCPYYDASECMYIRPLPSTCNNDQQCQGSDRCCCFNCGYRCVPTVKVKPGQCPAKPKECPFFGAAVEGPELSVDGPELSVDGPELSVDGPELSVGKEDLIKWPRRCKTDANCRGALKCCDSCGKKCLPPLKEHSGFCPVSNEQISCVSFFERSCCANDEDCKSNFKCCLVDNRMECVPALKEKNGICPRPIKICKKRAVPDKCKDDKDCVGNKKCCDTGCINECISPYLISIERVSPVVKPGTCPVVNTLVKCALSYPPGACTNDSQCPDKKKCCDVGCVLGCADV